jgi:uncharacterized protein (DUF305 family)
MTSERPPVDRDIGASDELALEEFGADDFGEDFDPDEFGDDLDGDIEGDLDDGAAPAPPLRRAPPIVWTFRSVLAAAVIFAVVGFAVGYFVAKPRPPGENSVDVGFMRDMIDHHDQAVEMALYTLAGQANGLTKTVAGDVLLSQRQEIGLMDGILGGWGRERGDPDRMAMEWMGHGEPVSQMFGMQPREEVLKLRTATSPEIDRLFFTMMRAHHEGGVHMAEYAEQHAQNKRVRVLAQFMANTQRLEINEIDDAIKRLGLG